ncbi:MAG: PilZ domain-containing protein [Candidatus Omnitrophica bacterium]|nr:PilZ domain-containing protein [Candidatus Omnitrophota bacterium]
MIRAKNTSHHSVNKRQYIRLKSIFPVEFKMAAAGHGPGRHPWYQGYTANVSEGGICLETSYFDESLFQHLGRENVTVELLLRIPMRSQPIRAKAKVAWLYRLERREVPHYQIGLQFSEIAYSDCDRMLRQARLLSVSNPALVMAVMLLVLGLVVSSFYGYRLRIANEGLVDSLARAQEEETRVRRDITEIDNEKKILSEEMKKYAQGLDEHRTLSGKYDELVQRENRITDRLKLLERQKSDMRQTVIEKMVQWLKNHQNPLTGLVLSFEGNVGVVKDWAFIYDQALAADVFLLFDDERDARRILNFFKRQMTDDFQGFHNAYYYDSGEIAEHTVHAGPNIWVGISIMQYTARSKDDYYLPVARKIADWLVSLQDADPEGGIRGGPQFTWFATEHNLDAYAFFGMMYRATSDEKYDVARKKVLSWLKTYALIPHGKDYQSPPINRGRGDATIATDTFAWSLAAVGAKKLGQLDMDPEAIMNFAEEHCAVTVFFRRPSGVEVEASGFDFAKYANTPRGGMISPEWTSQMIVSYQILAGYLEQRGRLVQADYYREKAKRYLNELNKLVISSPSAKGQGEGCLPYATLPDADTGHGWTTPLGTTTCSVAGTAYMIMAIKEFNPLELH